ncbi:MAG: DUF262 domain-containing protein [Planctomycetes bacterium]|nr:DUF262 domain-containing protein [Planctomycetota bacterium]
MNARETEFVHIIEGTSQFLVPHFQRPYTWERGSWDTLWDDLEMLVRPETSRMLPKHFMGAIVTAPAHSVPEGVTKWLLVDGQQRLTTLLLVLAAIRDRARDIDAANKLADSIHELYLTNRFQDGTDRYKLLPPQGKTPAPSDRAAFVAVIDRKKDGSASQVHAAYQYFCRMLRGHSIDQLDALTKSIVSRILLVSIVLEGDDNPYAIFESLNAKGQPLTQSDLVRNFFFMSIDAKRHDEVYEKKWIPMEQAIGRDSMEAYLRHFLIRRGRFVREASVYFTLKNEVEKEGRNSADKNEVEREGRNSAERELDDLVRVAQHYERFIHPEREESAVVRERLVRLECLRATVCYPFLLRVFEDRASGKLGEDEVVRILDIIENFIVRRYVCGEKRAELNEIFTALYRKADLFTPLSEGVKEVLGSRNYPGDEEFASELKRRKLYGAGEARQRAKLILEMLESSQAGAERVALTDLQIEHVMPQTLNDWWREHLGDEAEETHGTLLHTIGNLTLTGYNPALSNSPFPEKRKILRDSRLVLNAEIAKSEQWTKPEIEQRAGTLADLALRVWPSFVAKSAVSRPTSVKGTKPKRLFVYGQTFDVRTWQEVLRHTLEQVTSLGDDVVDNLFNEFPDLVKRSGSELRTPKELRADVYFEGNLSADSIFTYCKQLAQTVGWKSHEWSVETDA